MIKMIRPGASEDNAEMEPSQLGSPGDLSAEETISKVHDALEVLRQAAAQ
jgi:hypothetical protein